MLKYMMIHYDLIYFFLIVSTFPFWIFKLIKPSFRAKLSTRLRPECEQQTTKTIWVHAVSVGEVRSLFGLIRCLEKEHGKKVVFSVTTPAGLSCARENLPHTTVIQAPLDFSFTIKKFLRRINPGLFVLNELEIWPNWINQLKQNQIPVILINGRMGEKAKARYKLVSFLLKPAFGSIDRFLLQSEIYRDSFLELGARAERVLVCGNSKADEAWDRAESLPGGQVIRDYLGLPDLKKTIITLASSHKSDEDFYLPLLAEIKGDFFPIIAPRHPQRSGEIERKLRSLGFNPCYWLAGNRIPAPADIMIFSAMGYLMEIMTVSELVIMGGGRDRSISGHNLYEPAAQGKIILGGEYLQSFPEIALDLQEKGVYQTIKTADDFFAFFESWPAIDKTAIFALAREAVSKKKGSQKCILDLVLSLSAT